MATVHLLTQYIWPDAAPTGLYAEQLAARLEKNGADVRLIGGQGGYRAQLRSRPVEQLVYLDHYKGRRGHLRQTFAEYASVTRAFRAYIDKCVRPEDVVIVTSAPPNTVMLAETIRRRGACAIYWLQDYYPELVRGLHEYPSPLRKAFRRFWDSKLARWDRVVKIGENLGGPRENAVVIRNWPTLSFDEQISAEPGTAIYSGNLGFGHDIALLVDACEKLRLAGYRITMRCDGRGVHRLPGWLRPEPLQNDPAKLQRDLFRHEIHLVAAHPKITEAIFPSKIWNSLAARRELICTGFAGAMTEELRLSRQAPFERHLPQWLDLLQPALGLPQATLASAA
jgi:colanic acid biosynthesis glycosyl transferase WcaI